jgi:ribosomal protection tetracycline resistance protein
LKTLNLGILAHVDAGKTSLTERLLYAAGVIDAVGSVDDGNTQTDSLALERQRGITIKAAVVSFAIGDVTVNLIDTPGHPDFIAEVERVLSVLDGAVLVVSAVEGVQAQTRVLMRALRRLGIPTLIFVNKIDRAGARDSFKPFQNLSLVPMGRVTGAGTRDAAYLPGLGSDALDILSQHDDSLIAQYVAGDVSPARLRESLVAQSKRGLVHPVLFGSAITGAGVDALLEELPRLLPTAEGDAGGPLSGTVFKVERGPAGEKVAYVRLFSGTLRARDRLDAGKVTAVGVFHRGAAVEQGSVSAGQIAKLWGLPGIRIGDALGSPRERVAGHHHFAPPTLETIVVPGDPRSKGALHTALAQLAEQDPLINLRVDGARQEIALSLYGEVQKEVIQATLATEFGIGVSFQETTTICVERVARSGAAVEHMGAAGNPFRAGVGLRIDPAPIGSGVRFVLGIERGSLTPAFAKAVEETVYQTLVQGLKGWQVVDCTVTLTYSAYTPPPPYGWSIWSSSAGDFRCLTPLVLMAALEQAGTAVLEPMHRFALEVPADTSAAVNQALARLGAIPLATSSRDETVLLEGEIAAARVHGLQQELPSLTRGEGVLESAFAHYREVHGELPVRPRWDHNPLHRKEYLLHVVRRV